MNYMLYASRLILHGALAVSFWLFLATLPPFHIGLWVDSEAVLVGAYLLFSLMGVGLLAHYLCEPVLYSRRSMLLALTFGLSCVATMWAENKVLHHYGAPMLGEGTALWAGLTLMSFAYDQLDGARLRWIKLSACLAACVAGTLVLCNNLIYFGKYPEWAPYVFAAFLAPMALVAGLCGWLAAAIPLLILSHNKTLIFAVVGACGAWWVLRSYSAKWRVAIIGLLPMGVIALDFVGQYMWDVRYGMDSGEPLILGNWWSLRSRALAVLVYVLSWLQEPWRLVSGYGWGSYFEHLQQNITSLPISLFHHGAWRPNWDGVDRIDFHVMHQGLEHLFSLGVAGLLLYIGLLFLPFYKTEVTFRRFMVAVGFASVTSTWFTLPTVWPYWMLAWVLVMPKGQVTLFKRSLWAPLAMCISVAIVGHAAWNQWQTAVLYPTHEKSWLRRFTYSESQPSFEKWQRPYNVKGFHMPYFLFNLVSKKDQIPLDALRQELSPSLAAYHSRSSTLLLDISMLHVMKFLAPQDAKYGDMWGDVVKAILCKAPKRSDMVETYIQYALQHDREQDAQMMIDGMLTRSSHDVCALWYKGLLLSKTPQKKEGLNLMRQALLRGVERWVPTPQDLVEKLKNPLPVQEEG